jgi:hypothetical protein
LTKASEICARRFRRDFDVWIFPKLFYAAQGIKKIYNMPCHAMHPMHD